MPEGKEKKLYLLLEQVCGNLRLSDGSLDRHHRQGAIRPIPLAMTRSRRQNESALKLTAQPGQLPVSTPLPLRQAGQEREELLESVADDRDIEDRILEAVGMVQLELGGLHMEIVIPPGNHGRNGKTAVG